MAKTYPVQLAVGHEVATQFRRLAAVNGLQPSELGLRVFQILLSDPSRFGLAAPLEQRFAGIPCDLDGAIAVAAERNNLPETG